MTTIDTSPTSDRKSQTSQPIETEEQFLQRFHEEFEARLKLIDSEPAKNAFRRYGTNIRVQSHLSIDQLEPVRRSLRRVCEKHHCHL